MKARQEKIRNFSIIAHIDHCLLYTSDAADDSVLV